MTDSMTVFYGTCINAKASNPFVDDGFVWCRLKEGYSECEYANRWNECTDFKPVRVVWREIKEQSGKKKAGELKHGVW